MTHPYQTENRTIKHDLGEFEVTVRWYYDNDSGRPWEESDGNVVIVPLARGRSKPPGYRRLGSSDWYMDVFASVQKAIKDQWGGVGTTTRERAADAVYRNFEYHRGWVEDEWHWCGISVTMAGEDEEFDAALWGIGSEEASYHGEVIAELADQIINETYGRD